MTAPTVPLPAVTTYRVRRPLLTLARRMRNSQFARDLSRGYRRSAAIIGCVAAAYACIVVTRGLFVVAAAFGVAQP